jgi:hypothetical protein
MEEALPDTDVASGRLHTNTLWTLFLPDHGSITVSQHERGDDIARHVFLPAMQWRQPRVGDVTVKTTGGNSRMIVDGTQQFTGIGGSAVEFDRVRRFDPRAGQLVADVVLPLRYYTGEVPPRPCGHLTGAASSPPRRTTSSP